MTHRDPPDTIVSVTDVCAVHSARFTDEVDMKFLGAVNVEHWSVGMQRALAFRDKHPDRFYDIGFRAMQSDPITQVRGLYDWLGQPVTAEFEAGMKQWWHENAENREKNVHPDPSAFGIDLDQIRPLFAEYTSRMSAYIGH